MKVKPFNWFDETGSVSDRPNIIKKWACYLMGGWGGYVIQQHRNEKFSVWVGGFMEPGQFPTFEDAENFACDDFTNRIMKEIEQ